MEKKILLFGFSRSGHSDLIEALRRRGFGITATVSLTRLHFLLSVRRFAAILIPEGVTLRYKMQVTRHLWQVRASRVVLVLRHESEAAAPGWAFTAHRGPGKKDNGASPLPECFGELEDTILHAGEIVRLRRQSALETAERECFYGKNPVPEGIELTGFHKKMGEILRAIITSGETGIEGPALQRRIWPRKPGDRRKDIQIYVSKIRKRLDCIEPNRFVIKYDKGRYRFNDMQGQ